MGANSVKSFDSGMTGAPQLVSNAAGSLVALLDAVAVAGNGFGLKTVNSLVIASNVATMTITSGHGARPGTVVAVSGITGGAAALNGEQRAVTTDATHITFATTGIADMTAAGTIEMKIAPLGWEINQTGTNLRGYRSSDVLSSRCVLRIDDTDTLDGRVVGYESMSAIDTGVNPFPTAAQVSGGGYWGKSRSASSSGKPWFIVGDERLLYLFVATDAVSGPTCYRQFVFGDFIPEWTADPWPVVLSHLVFPGNNVNTTGIFSTVTDLSYCDPTNHPGALWFPRSYTSVGGSAAARKNFAVFAGNAGSGFSGDIGNATPYPNGPNQGLYLEKIRLHENTGPHFRGVLPGLYACPQNIADTVFATGDRIDPVGFLPGRIVKAINCNSNTSGVYLFVDCTGPWR